VDLGEIMEIKGRAYTPEHKRAIIERLYVVWLQQPSLRLGQLIENSVIKSEVLAGRVRQPSIFFVEDEELIKCLERYKSSLEGSCIDCPNECGDCVGGIRKQE
jgi:hypothetical protein